MWEFHVLLGHSDSWPPILYVGNRQKDRQPKHIVPPAAADKNIFFMTFIWWSLTWGGGPRRQLVWVVMGMLRWLSRMWDGRGLGKNSGSGVEPQSGIEGRTRPFCCPYPSDGRVSLQDEPGQRLSQVTVSSTVFYIWNNSLNLKFFCKCIIAPLLPLSELRRTKTFCLGINICQKQL